MGMTPDRWARIHELFHRALEAGEAGREQLLSRACTDDPELRREVEALLAAHRTEVPVLDHTPEVVATMLGQSKG